MSDTVHFDVNQSGVSTISPGRLLEPKTTVSFEGRQADEFRRLQKDRAFTELLASAIRQTVKAEEDKHQQVDSARILELLGGTISVKNH